MMNGSIGEREVPDYGQLRGVASSRAWTD